MPTRLGLQVRGHKAGAHETHDAVPRTEGAPGERVTVDLKNQPGELARLCEAIAGRGINLVLSATARGEEGIVVFIADDEASAETVLQDADIQYTMRPALTIRMENQPGAGAATFRELVGAGVNVDLLLPVRVSDDLFFRRDLCRRRGQGPPRARRPSARAPGSRVRSQIPLQMQQPPRDLRPSAASWTPRRHEDICEAKREAGPDALPGQYPGVTPERLRSRIAQTFGGTAAAPGRSSGVAGHTGISPCRGKTASRVAMIAWSAGWPGS